MAPIPRLQPYAGPALFSYGFRPFFLFGALYAGLAVLVWMPVFAGELALLTAGHVPANRHVLRLVGWRQTCMSAPMSLANTT